MVRNASVVLACIVCAVSPGIAQELQKKAEGETSRDVPALSAFHSVMHPLWHTAWPEKNIGMLNELLPEAEKLGADVIRAALPPILHEKGEKWNEQIRSFEASLKEYRAAASPPDTQRLLDAVERLHSDYEKLVRILRPVLKELDDFHVSLYTLYHHLTPAGDIESIRASVAELQETMKALNAATLPARLKSKEEAFRLARAALDTSVQELATALSGGDRTVINNRIEAMHTRYQEVERLFE